MHDGDLTRFTVHDRDGELGSVSFRMPGRHNVLNALATIAVARELELDFATIAEGFSGFGGVGRRFQRRYDKEIMVVDDYGHHPTEIRATLAAARSGWDRRLVVVFQPHRYSRTEALFADFVTAFNQADHLIITDIYAAGEAPREGITAEKLADSVRLHGHRDVHYLADFDAIDAHLQQVVRDGDIVITLGAGNIWQVGERLAQTRAGNP
jgi:UDP-N-acetylmuramate--alanine ligase